MIVMGIDPSLRSTGYAFLLHWKGRFTPVALGLIIPPRRFGKADSLRYIHDVVEDLAERHNPHGFGIEAGYVGLNSQTALLLGEVRGAVLAGISSDAVVEVEPTLAKLCVAGDGRATKSEVCRAVRNLLELEEMPTFDVADAAAVAVAAAPDLLSIARRKVV